MCTVTILPIRGEGDTGFRLACNRDESRRRPPALPPVVRACGPRFAVFPVDPLSDGTWIAANDRGVVMTLLNVYAAPVPRADPDAVAPVQAVHHRSRGEIIPSLMIHDTVDAALVGAASIHSGDYPPFRLVMVDAARIAELHSNGSRITLWSGLRGDGPWLFTSSGLGDELVDPPRRELFLEMFDPSRNVPEVQDEYHRHVWPDQPHLSVCMSRPEACTVSYTVVECIPGAVRLRYFGEPPSTPVNPRVVELTR